MNVEIMDRIGKAIEPREWFLVPLPVIDEAIEQSKTVRLRDVTMTRRE